MQRLLRTTAPAIAMALALALVVYGVMFGWGSAGPASKLTPTPQITPVPNPLSIAALRAKSFPGGALSQTATIGQTAAYRDSIISWPSDGLAQYARTFVPIGQAPAGGWPVVVLLHGYVDPANWRTDGSDYVAIMSTLAESGFAVIRVDYQGHGQSQGSPVGGHFAPDYTYNTLNLLASLKNQTELNPKRVGLLGHSLGGHVALRSIVVSPEIKATALMAGVTGSFEDIVFNWPRSPVANDRPAAVVQSTRTKLLAQFGDPRQNPSFWSAASAINFVQSVRGPVQLNHSVADSNVPLAFSTKLDAALKSAGKSSELIEYPGDDHQFIVNRAGLMQNLIRFYKANL